jgi:DnaJ-class molecular chaperone
LIKRPIIEAVGGEQWNQWWSEQWSNSGGSSSGSSSTTKTKKAYTCPTCGGGGMISYTKTDANGEITYYDAICPTCKGTGIIISNN